MSDYEESVEEELEYDDDYYEEEFEAPVSASFAAADLSTGIKHNESQDDLHYSEDFEASVALHDVKPTPKVSPPLSKAIPVTTVKSPSASAVTLPPTSMQALQAEVALDELSKEVVRLRNEQKNALKERRAQAKIKKERANLRRVEYQAELSTQRDTATRLQQENTRLTLQLRDTTLQLTGMCEEKQLVDQLLLKSEVRLSETVSRLDEQTRAGAALEATLQQVREGWRADKDKLQEENTRANLFISVLQKNAELNEERLAKDRERLPEYHQR